MAEGNDNQGHAAHTQDSEIRGLPGEFKRPIKITFLGAGSGFTPRLLNDVFQTPGHLGGTVALVDIDENRLYQMQKLVTKVADKLGQGDKWEILASPRREEVMGDSDYLVCCVEVSGVECVRFDNDIPHKYGVDQCIGDTIGPGGLFKGLRTIPVFLEILKDAERLCPNAIMMNYTNPMNMMCLAAFRTSHIPVVGLCHSVQGSSHQLARYAEVPYEELVWECAGINHLAWFTKVRHDGKDLYPFIFDKWRKELDQAFSEGFEIPTDVEDPRKVERPEHHHNLVRKHMALTFGAYITESSGHLSEYLPWYRKRPELIDKYARPGYDGETSFYADCWPKWRNDANQKRDRLINEEEEINWRRSWEYASWIIEAHQKDRPWRIHGNVYNKAGDGGRLITNLPDDACVEVAIMCDQNGLNPTRYGALPRQMAAICDSNIRMFDLGAQAAIEKSKELAFYAMTLDPLTAAVCDLEEIKKMTHELFEAEAQFLPGYK